MSRTLPVLITLLLLGSLVAAAETGSKREFQRQEAKRWSRIEETVRDSARVSTKHFLNQHGQDFRVPIEVDIFLWGFDGDGAYGFKLDVNKLQETLTTSFMQHCPAVWEEQEQLSTCLQVQTTIQHVDNNVQGLRELEQLLTLNMVPAGRHESGDNEVVPSYDVEASNLEHFFVGFLDLVYSNRGSQDVGHKWHQHNAIIVVNPNKLRMSPLTGGKGGDTSYDFFSAWRRHDFDLDKLRQQEGGYVYRYKYNGAGASATWTSQHNFVVIDVSAGPCHYGPVTSRAGAVMPQALPEVQDTLERMLQELQTLPAGTRLEYAVDVAQQGEQVIFIGQLTSVLTSAIRFVFMPDIKCDHIEYSRRVLVPIVVLADHFDDVTENGMFHRIDMHAIEAAVKQMLAPEQEAVLSSAHHYLHTHKQLASAVRKAIHHQSQAVVQQVPGEGLHKHSSAYIDADLLLEEFALAGDLLTYGLIQGSHLQDLHAGVKPHGALKHAGTRVLPVYVLSLKNAPEDVVFGSRELVAADHDAVVVLQLVGKDKASSQQFSGHMLDGQRLAMDTLDPNRHIIAGLAQGLAGVTPPYQRYDTKEQRYVYDWLWATGATPFGPYSNFTGIGAVAAAQAQRNILLSHVEAAIRSAAGRMESVDSFVKENLEVPFSHFLERAPHFAHYLQSSAATQHAFNECFSRPEVESMEKRLGKMGDDLFKLSMGMFQHDWQAAGTRVEQLLVDVGSFGEVVEAALERARDVMACCGMRRASLRTSMVIILVCAAFMALVFAVVVGVVCCVGNRRGGRPGLVGLPTYKGLGSSSKGPVLAF